MMKFQHHLYNLTHFLSTVHVCAEGGRDVGEGLTIHSDCSVMACNPPPPGKVNNVTCNHCQYLVV